MEEVRRRGEYQRIHLIDLAQNVLHIVFVPAFTSAADVVFLRALSAVGAKFDVLVDKRLRIGNLPGKLRRRRSRKEKPPPSLTWA